MSLGDRLKRVEGFKDVSYKDSKGVWTVGHGINLQNRKFEPEVLDLMFNTQILQARQECSKFLKYYKNLNQARQDVIAELMFNLGWPRFSGFVLFHRAMNLGDFNTAGKELRNSKWYKDVGLERADALIETLENGDYSETY